KRYAGAGRKRFLQPAATRGWRDDPLLQTAISESALAIWHASCSARHKGTQRPQSHETGPAADSAGEWSKRSHLRSESGPDGGGRDAQWAVSADSALRPCAAD